MIKARWWVPFLLGTMLTLVSNAQAANPTQSTTQTIEERLVEADKAFQVQDYDRAIAILRPVLSNNLVKEPIAKRQLKERLGASYWFIGAVDAARLTFSALLKEDADHELDPLYYPSELITFYETEKMRLLELGFIGGRVADGSGSSARRLTLVKTITQRPMPTLGYLMPFGVGQFANDDGVKGTLLASFQGVGLAANIAAWVTIEAMKKPGTNLVSSKDSGQVEVMETLWWIGTSLFAASYIYSIVDGLISLRPDEEIQRRFKLLEPEDLPEQETSNANELKVVPSTAGLGLGVSGSF